MIISTYFNILCGGFNKRNIIAKRMFLCNLYQQFHYQIVKNNIYFGNFSAEYVKLRLHFAFLEFHSQTYC